MFGKLEILLKVWTPLMTMESLIFKLSPLKHIKLLLIKDHKVKGGY